VNRAEQAERLAQALEVIREVKDQYPADSKHRWHLREAAIHVEITRVSLRSEHREQG